MNEERVYKKLDSIDSKLDGFIDKQHKRDIEFENRLTKTEVKVVGFAIFFSMIGTALTNLFIKKL